MTDKQLKLIYEYMKDCGSHIILNSYWNGISNFHCIVCGTCEEDAIGIFSIKTGERAWSNPYPKLGFRTRPKDID